MANPTRRVAVIGAGISGIATAAHLKKESIEVTVFERSGAAGGIWLYDERQPPEPSYTPVPVSKTGDSYIESVMGDVEERIHAPPGPCYVGLKNNVSTRLLETTLNRFPVGTDEFVSHNVLKDYIQSTAIASGVHELTRYNTEVKTVLKQDKSWIVEAATLHIDDVGVTTRILNSSVFDAVVVASGHYHAPKVPNTPGLADWKRLWPERVKHSKSYRSPGDGHGKNYLLVGGSVSSMDIARELGPVVNRIYQSQRKGAFDLSASLLPENGYRVDEVVSYDTPMTVDNSFLVASEPIPATVTLKSGQKLCGIHHVILCTGYHLTLPFLQHLHSDGTPAESADEHVLVTDGTQFHNLHKDIFYISDPSLAFVGVPFFTATFTLFEFQAMVVGKVFSGQARLPSEKIMRSEYNRRVETKGYGKAFHSLRDREAEYVEELLAWVNHDLEEAGRRKLPGHTEQWHTARAAQVQRIRALLAAPSQERSFQITCQ